MMNQKERLENFVANSNQVEMETDLRLYSEAVELLRKGFCERFVANRCFLPMSKVKELKEKLI